MKCYILRDGYYPIRIKIKIGNQSIDRFLEKSDILCDNRQPTLHKYSFISCNVKSETLNTINHHLSYTPGMNCDFDGDECNLWNVQNEEVELG